MTNETEYDFRDGNGPVAAHRHSNGGGWVADTAYVDDSAFVGPTAFIFGSAMVYGSARVFGNAKVFDNAMIYGNGWVYGSAMVFGNGWVWGNAMIFGNAWIYSNARVCGNANITNSVLTASRSDGYIFTIFDEADGTTRITAGCRFFTIPEAIEHWTKTRGDTKLGLESIAIVKYLEYMHSLEDMK